MIGGGAFWSDVKLERRMRRDRLVRDGDGRCAFDPDYLDGAGYRLRMGAEAYVSPATEDDRTTITELPCHKSFTIPPGQFAFLITEEVVSVPNDALAFIALRSKAAKFRGLVNVSGFHADPGYTGRLIFSVFNAGPGDVHLRRGDQLFTVMFADLDGRCKRTRKEAGYMRIPAELVAPIAGRLQSLAGLKEGMEEVEDRLGDRLHKLERDVALARWAAALGLGALVSLLIKAYAGG